MKVFLTGKTGQVGFELHRTLSTFTEVFAPSRAKLDLFDLSAVTSYLDDIRPDIVINAAAWTAVDAAESNKEKASVLNTELPKTLADYCAKTNALLIHYSSDYVYDGSGTEERVESDPPSPISTYGVSKLQGDLAIKASEAPHFIFRTSWVYSARGNNFMKTMLRLGTEKAKLSIVDDQVGSPTPARLIAQLTSLAIQKWATEKSDASLKLYGTYHLVSEGHTSWYNFAQSIFDYAKKCGVKLSIKELQGIPTLEYPTPAQRPLNSRLNTSAIEQLLDIKLPPWEQQLQLTLDEYIETASLGN